MELLDPATASRLKAEHLTYRRAGPDASQPPTDGSHRFSRTVELRRSGLDRAAADLLGWRVHEKAGLRVAASAPRAAVGEVVLMRLGPGPASIRIPCRVVEVVDEPDRRGFSYGTLPGHPESGEERFLLERIADDRVTFTVSAFSRPATLLARAGGPAARAFQRLMTTRYLEAPDRLAG